MVLFAIIKKVLFWWIQNKGSQGEMGWLGFQQFWCLQKSPAVDTHRREQYLVSRCGNEGGLTVWINCFRQTNISLGRDQHHQQHQNRHGCLGSFQIFILTYISNLQSIIWGSDDANRAIRGNMADNSYWYNIAPKTKTMKLLFVLIQDISSDWKSSHSSFS